MARALEIHDRLCRLQRLNIGGDVLRLYGATRFDLALLAAAEDALSQPPPDNPEEEQA